MAGTESSTSFTVCFSRGASPSVSIDRHISTDTPDSPDGTIVTPHDTDHAGCDVREVRSHESCASTGSTVCRICQLTEAESEAVLEETGCRCKGSVRMCHRDCIQTWIRTTRSTRCEVCDSAMAYNLLLDIYNVASNETVEPPSPPRSTCEDNRRAWFLVISVLLCLVTCSAAVMTLHVKQQYQVLGVEEVYTPTLTDTYTYHLFLSISVFCGTIALGFALLWVLWEVVVAPRERELNMATPDWTTHNMNTSYPGARVSHDGIPMRQRVSAGNASPQVV